MPFTLKHMQTNNLKTITIKQQPQQ